MMRNTRAKSWRRDGAVLRGPEIFQSCGIDDFLPGRVRILLIDQLIRDGNFPNCTQMAERCGVSRKTIQRDLNTLKFDMNAPVQYDASHKGYYYAKRNFALPAMMMNEQELFAVLVAERAMANYAGTPLEGQLKSIFARLMRFLPDDMMKRVHVVSEKMYFAGMPAPKIDEAIWQKIHQALSEQCTVAMTVYVASRNAVSTREFDPYAIVVRERDWFLVGYDHLRKTFRYFYIPRIRRFVLTGKEFDEKADFNLEKILRDGFAAVQGTGKPVTVALRFDEHMAEVARERAWADGQDIRIDSRGRVTISFQTNALFQVKRNVLQWGDAVEVLKPKSLRDEMKTTLQRMLARY